MERKISECENLLISWCVLPQAVKDLQAWLTDQAKEHNLYWLLAHTDNGLIWGKLRDDQLQLSSDAFPDQSARVTLDWITLQQCRLFGEPGELFLWKTGQRWQARLYLDGIEVGTSFYMEEEYLLWGTRKEDEAKGFLLLAEGSQGIYHAPPLTITPTEMHRAALLVRHYLIENLDTGLLHIRDSRFVKLLEPVQRACHGKSTR
jgi:CRISPR-associated protein (TIGR03984 family)